MKRDDTQLAAFGSSHDALNFAYKHAHGDYPRNMLAKFGARQPGKATAIKNAIEAATVAGWVRQVIEGGETAKGLPEPYRSVLLAKFAVDSRLNLTAKMVVLEHVLALALGTGLHKRRMVDLCVQRYFGGTMVGTDGVRRPIRQHQVADWCDVSQPTVSNTYGKVRDWIMSKERDALALVEQSLVARGMVAG
ncbi:MAG: hypothetical protein EOO54_26730 [Haliea sp.]|nr:MAG: hypothetical protein EOO54_26730 [Haliea sp.]